MAVPLTGVEPTIITLPSSRLSRRHCGKRSTWWSTPAMCSIDLVPRRVPWQGRLRSLRGSRAGSGGDARGNHDRWGLAPHFGLAVVTGISLTAWLSCAWLSPGSAWSRTIERPKNGAKRFVWPCMAAWTCSCVTRDLSGHGYPVHVSVGKPAETVGDARAAPDPIGASESGTCTT